jgi:hypothetical protein
MAEGEQAERRKRKPRDPRYYRAFVCRRLPLCSNLLRVIGRLDAKPPASLSCTFAPEQPS